MEFLQYITFHLNICQTIFSQAAEVKCLAQRYNGRAQAGELSTNFCKDK
uniref:Uncharacterized protein n=1 Tax=Anguilla anguilla TaxID=7936 RepID=A0A0E9XJU3_ANGAN